MQDYYTTTQELKMLFGGWNRENLIALFDKMTKKGIQKGGILNTNKENKALYKYLKKELNK